MTNVNSMPSDAISKYGFFLKGSAKGVLLIHGITGTPSEMRYLGKKLNKAGFTVLCDTLPGHCSSLGDLKKVTWQEISTACVQSLKFLKQHCDEVFVGGLSMGALMQMAMTLILLQPTDVDALRSERRNE